MAVAYNSVGTRSSATTGTTVTPALPAAPSAGDLLVALVSVKNNATISTTTAGWVKLAQTNSGASFTVAAFYAIYQTSGVNAPAFTWTGSANNQAQVARFTGNLNAYFMQPAKSTPATGTTATHTSNALSSIAADSLAFLYDLCAAATAFATPTNWSAAFDAGSNAAELSGKTRAGATNATSATGGAAAWVAQQLEILAPTNYNLPFPSQGQNNANVAASVWTTLEAAKADAYYRFVGGPQPNDSRNVNPAFEVNQPPNSPPGAAAEASIIYSAWAPQPDPNAYRFFGGAQPFDSRNVSPAIENVPADTVLFKDPFGVVELPDYPIVLPPKIAALSPAAAVADFVPRALTWLSTVVAAWAPLDAAPVLARHLAPGIPGVSVDAPVPSSTANEQKLAFDQWPASWTLPVVAKNLSPGIPGRSIDRPPVKRQTPDVAAWTELPRLPITGRFVAAIAPGGSIDPPPYLRRPWLSSVVGSWDGITPLPTRGRFTPPATPATVDNPIPRSTATMQSIVFTICADALNWNFYSVFRPAQIPGGGGNIVTDYYTVSGVSVEMLFPDYGVSNPNGAVSFPYPMVRRTN